ncbi:cysteine-rich receptor-like protein kinase 10 [Tasmannia lanceolata]|uniref:cysteine-rich receptor-like protein kinase 10 n=1 Tax=Tasmannia lanceolata TaxID=3420 RepID=UPI0040636D7D
MKFLESKSIYFLLFTCLLSLFQIPIKAQQPPIFQDCSNSANYTNGSQFETNLNLLLSSLTSNVSLDGFYNISTGEDPDLVYGLVQCRGDISITDCRTCLNTSSTAIINRCPNKRDAAVRFDYCLLRYSDRRFFSEVENNLMVLLTNTQNASDPDLFNFQLGSLLNQLSSTAGSAPSKFATGNISYANPTRIYGLVQCTRDLSDGNCSSCVESIIQFVPKFLSVGGQVLSVSCNLGYETHEFFQALPPPPPPVATSPQPPPDGKKKTSRTVIIIVISVGITLALITTICICLLRRKAIKTKFDIGDDDEIGNLETTLFDLSTLRAATGNFCVANKLGEGGFGPVYKGKLTDGQEIAVKRLSRCSAQGIAELRNEVVVVAKLHHRNLVRLLGFCLEEEEKMLVYEYLPNTSLDKFLFDAKKRVQLDWERRYKIIGGIARGLLYLHEDSRLKIVHRDLKASNILLDANMNPKISDFGLARLFGSDQTQANTLRIAGTYGYMAPEYAMHGQFSTKSDVYSFGVLVLEILSGQRNSGLNESGRDTDLTSNAWKHWAEGTELELIDKTLDEKYHRSEVLRCIHMGLLCVQEDAGARPSMSSIVLMLDSYSVTLQAPSPPIFFVRGMKTMPDLFTTDSDLQASYSDRSTIKLIPSSINGMSITEFEPR